MTHEEWMATRWRGKRLDTGEYAYGNLVVTGDAELGKDLNKRCILVDAGMVGEKDLTATWEVTPDSLERCTGMKCAIDGRLFYEGDRVKSAYLPEAVFTLRFGPHREWCELDRRWELGVGFYAEDEDRRQCPIENLSEWAERVEEESENE